jgi:bifunctional N-acetylglucosamine-1-phosphate-uridyltransferase/glucosamine-1-phosphate-acetyltransferase GlmU-like protein
MSVHSVEITTEKLLSAVVNLPESEFERLFTNAKKLRRTLPEKTANKEVRLIKKVNNSVLSDAERMRFNELVEKRRDENIGENELNELIALTEKGEELNVKRLKYLVEISNIRNKSLREVMKELEIFPPQTI